MAMNKTVLATSIVDALATLETGLSSGAQRTQAIARWELIADEIIKHFIANAVVVPNPSFTGTVSGGSVTCPNGTGKISA